MYKFRNDKILEERLDQLSPWNFLIEIKPGIFTIPRHQWIGQWSNIVIQDYISRNIFPFLAQLSDVQKSQTTVIDIGCNEGWLTMLLWKYGFKRILGIDGNPNNIEKANFFKEYYEMDNVDFVCEDIHEFNPRDKFDICIMLGVSNHLYNPIQVFKNICSFTNKYLIIDFYSLCDDFKDTNPEFNPNTGLSSVFGNIQCYFEKSDSLTSISEGNLVFQFSRRAMQMMLNFVGFSNVTELLPGVALPPNYKNDKRVFLSAKKHWHDKFIQEELQINEQYERAQANLKYSQPILKKEGLHGYNIVEYNGNFYGIPQGKFLTFDITEILFDEECAMGISFDDVQKMIIDHIIILKTSPMNKICGEIIRDKIKFSVGQELIIQSQTEKAKKIFNDILLREKERNNTEMISKIYFDLGRIAQKEQNAIKAKEYFQKCIVVCPEFHEASIRLKMLDNINNNIRCHSVFQ